MSIGCNTTTLPRMLGIDLATVTSITFDFIFPYNFGGCMGIAGVQ